MKRTEIYFMRHAESQRNTEPHLICGRSNETPLTDRGVEQARTLGRYLKEKDIVPTRVFSSPAVRAHQTAIHALGEFHDIPVFQDGSLQELDQGDWTGRLRKEMYSVETFAKIAQLGKDFKAPNGESMNEVGERMFEWLTLNVPMVDNQPEKILVFSHGMAIRCLASKIHDWSQAKTFRLKTPNTSMSLFVPKDGTWQLEYLGKEPK